MKKSFIPLILLTSLYSFADDDSTSYFDTIINGTKEYREYIHNSLTNLSSSLDNYSNEKINLNDYDSSYAFIELSSYLNEHEGLSFDQKVRIKLQLPKLQDKLKLVFESDEIRETKDYIENHNKNSNDDYNLALAYNKMFSNIDFRTKVGVKLHSTLDPFIKVEGKRKWEDIYGLDFILSQSFKESVDKKLESTSYFQIDKYLDDYYSLHNYNEHYWQSEFSKNSEFYHSIYLNQKLSNKNYLTYQIDTNIDNIDSDMKVKRYSGSVKFRHYIKKWLYTEVIPENYYREDNSFESKYAIKVNLGMYFNKGSY